MFVKVTAEGEVALTPRVQAPFCAKPGDNLWIEESPDGVLLRARRVVHARLAPLQARIRRGPCTFDLDAFRDERRGTEFRD